MVACYNDGLSIVVFRAVSFNDMQFLVQALIVWLRLCQNCDILINLYEGCAPVCHWYALHARHFTPGFSLSLGFLIEQSANINTIPLATLSVSVLVSVSHPLGGAC